MNTYRKLLTLVSTIVIAACAVILVMAGQDSTTSTPVQVEQRQSDANAAEKQTLRLIEKHGCWTKKAPAGVIPGHAVITHAEQTKPSYVGSLGVEVAIQQINGEDYGIQVHAFCP